MYLHTQLVTQLYAMTAKDPNEQAVQIAANVGHTLWGIGSRTVGDWAAHCGGLGRYVSLIGRDESTRDGLRPVGSLSTPLDASFAVVSLWAGESFLSNVPLVPHTSPYLFQARTMLLDLGQASWEGRQRAEDSGAPAFTPEQLGLKAPASPPTLQPLTNGPPYPPPPSQTNPSTAAAWAPTGIEDVKWVG